MSTVRVLMRGLRWRALDRGFTSVHHVGGCRSLGLGSGTRINSFESVQLSRRSFGSSPTRFAGKSEEESETKEDLGNLEDLEDSSASKANGAQASDGTAAGDSSTVADLEAQLAQKEEEIGKLNDLRIRYLADMENTRMIAKRDVANAHQYGITKFAKSLLEVADNLNRALGAIPAEKLEGGDKYLKELYIGVEMTRKELMRVFRSNEIKEFAAEGDEFDPNVHQALFESEIPGTKEGIIVSITKKGYMINDRVLRAAEVGVSKAVSEESEDKS
ncbi:hypothetical protein NDN08_006623 [Rhodosorus marinus]|uniref:GrpE protein homolog n=1 Tax=Rhodosorus marinus TaxID=101924 RepID=A0AAV8UI76_9RHOD|nr:hypothetical protein NDN08_006623 [Rhodosorus marinus]